MRLFSLICRLIGLIGILFYCPGFAQLTCEALFPAQQTTSSKILDSRIPPLLAVKSITDFQPDMDTSYLIENFKKIGASTTYPSRGDSETSYKSDWTKQIQDFFQTIPQGTNHQQVLALSLYATKFVFEDLIAFLRNVKGEGKPIKDFGLRNSSVYWKELLRFWKHQNLSESEINQGKLALTKLLMEHFDSYLPIDKFFVRFFMADNIQQFAFDETTLMKKNDPEFFKYTHMTMEKIQARRTLLHIVATKPVVPTKPQYFQMEESELISYITNEITALAPKLANEPHQLLETALITYQRELQIASDRRILPYLNIFPPHSGMMNFHKNMGLLRKTSDTFFPDSNLGVSFQKLASGIRQSVQKNIQDRREIVESLLLDYKKNPQAFLIQLPQLFPKSSIKVILDILSEINNPSDRKKYAHAYFMFIRSNPNFQNNIQYQRDLNELRH